MTLLELQKVLGERIDIARLNNLSEEQRKEENNKSEVIARLAKQMINNADIVLRTDKLVAEGTLSKDSNISRLLGSNDGS